MGQSPERNQSHSLIWSPDRKYEGFHKLFRAVPHALCLPSLCGDVRVHHSHPGSPFSFLPLIWTTEHQGAQANHQVWSDL